MPSRRPGGGIAKLSAPIRNEAAGPSWVDDARTRHLPRLPLSGRDHQSRGLMVWTPPDGINVPR